MPSESSPSPKAIKACAEAMVKMLEIGWRKSDIDKLEKIWWQIHDDQGNLRDAK